MVRPKALQQGARLAVVAPASAPRPELVQQGMDELRAWGYEPVLFPHALQRGPIYYAGSTEERAADLMAAFADESIDGIVCARGGWGSAELLPLLNAAVVRAHPKAFVGYSDLSSVHCWLENEAELVSFYAPMVAADFARAKGVDERSWRDCLEGRLLRFGREDGLRVLKNGRAKGRVRGGCLSILVESLGTPWAMRAEGGILFVEDVGTHPYQWDRMLHHMKAAGLLEQASGVVIGDMEKCVQEDGEAELLELAVLHALRDFDGPVAIGLRCGHVEGANLTLPLGLEAELDLNDASRPRLEFAQPAVV